MIFYHATTGRILWIFAKGTGHSVYKENIDSRDFASSICSWLLLNFFCPLRVVYQLRNETQSATRNRFGLFARSKPVAARQISLHDVSGNKGEERRVSRRIFTIPFVAPFLSRVHFQYWTRRPTFVVPCRSCTLGRDASYGQSQGIPDGTLTRVVVSIEGLVKSHTRLTATISRLKDSKFMTTSLWMTRNFCELLGLSIWLIFILLLLWSFVLQTMAVWFLGLTVVEGRENRLDVEERCFLDEEKNVRKGRLF